MVVRGGLLGAALIRSDASRYFSIYGVYGIPVFAADGITVDELAQGSPLVRFELLTLTQAGTLRRAGLRLEPTGRNFRHYTVAWDDLKSGIESLLACEHRTWRNPYSDE